MRGELGPICIGLALTADGSRYPAHIDPDKCDGLDEVEAYGANFPMTIGRQPPFGVRIYRVCVLRCKHNKLGSKLDKHCH